MKSIIIDDEKLVIGSMNFTKQGENKNDENCLIITTYIPSKRIVNAFLHLN